MFGFLFDSELAFYSSELGSMVRLSILIGQHGRLSNLGSMVGFLFTSWAAWSAFYSELGQHAWTCFLFTSWAAWSAFYSSEVGQHGRLSIHSTWAAWSAFYSILNLGSMVGFLF